MKILIILHFNSELGGLHDNVYATAAAAAGRGYEVHVACRQGLFHGKLQSAGIDVIEIDQDDTAASIENIIGAIGSDIDLIHAHPGSSRSIAMQLHDDYNIPVIYHVHGAWLDSVSQFIHKADSVFAVSEAVKQKVITAGGSAHKVHVIPNYSDYIYDEAPMETQSEDIKRISLITRLEKDKSRIIDEVKKLVPYLNKTDEKLNFDVIGDGSLRDELLGYLNTEVQNNRVVFRHLGWISDKDTLKQHILASHIIIGPGRVAIDAYTLRTPVIVVGSQNYQGYINSSNWQYLIHANFGGYGADMEEKGDIVADLDVLIKDEAVYDRTADIGSRVVDAFFNKQMALDRLFSVYEIVGQKR